jgi:cyclopropane fatty-acyl-phospholipid synthase-like methyltransferase
MENVDEYWTNRTVSFDGAPDIALFRFLGSVGSHAILAGARFLDIGFGHGADLLEAARRGAEVFGLDINPKSVERLGEVLGPEKVEIWKGGERFPFSVNFNVIVANDSIYYFSEQELSGFFEEASRTLAPGGTIVAQIIESDIEIPASEPSLEVDFEAFVNAQPNPIFPETNPIQLLQAGSVINLASQQGLTLKAHKVLIESYDLAATRLRVTRYFAWEKSA